MYIISITKFDVLTVANRFVVKKGWTHNGRIYNSNILVYVEQGECVFYINDNKYFLEKDSYIIVPKGVFYKPHTDTFCQYCYFHFEGEYLGETALSGELDDLNILGSISLDNCFVLPNHGKSTPKLIFHLNSIIDEVQSNTGGYKKRINITFLNALDCISYDKEQHGLAYEIHRYILENLTDATNLANISSHFGYSKQHIINQFKKAYNIPPTAFILQKRLELSLTYLLETSLNINEIAARCGFNDSNYYARVFRKKYNMSPQNYRQRYLNVH